jgi:hypothetical protein
MENRKQELQEFRSCRIRDLWFGLERIQKGRLVSEITLGGELSSEF